MNEWKYCPHCGKELTAGPPLSDAPIFPQHPQPQTNNTWGPITTWTNSGTLPR